MRYPLVFAYHDVSPHLRLSGNWVPPEVFRRHLSFLSKRFRPMDPKALSFPLPYDAFLLTFDDALEGVHRWAFPIMEEVGVKGAVFVITAFIGKRNLWDAHFGVPVRHMDRSAIIELHRSGWLVGSHTVSHRSLTTLPDRQLRYELEYSKKYLEDLIGEEVVAVAYPFNIYNRKVLSVAAEVGYRWGFAGPSYRRPFGRINVPRIPVMLPDLTLRHKLLPLYALVDVALTLPSRLTPLYHSLLNALRRR